MHSNKGEQEGQDLTWSPIEGSMVNGLVFCQSFSALYIEWFTLQSKYYRKIVRYVQTFKKIPLKCLTNMAGTYYCTRSPCLASH